MTITLEEEINHSGNASFDEECESGTEIEAGSTNERSYVVEKSRSS